MERETFRSTGRSAIDSLVIGESFPRRRRGTRLNDISNNYRAGMGDDRKLNEPRIIRSAQVG